MTDASTPVVFGNARFSVYAPGVIRLEFRQHNNFPKTPSVLTAPKLPVTLSADVTFSGKVIRIATGKLLLTYHDDGNPFNRDNLSIEHPFQRSRGTWHPGDPDKPLVELVRSLDVWPDHEHFEREEHPGLLNTDGRFCLVDDSETYLTRDRKWISAVPRGLRGQDWWFFGYGYDYAGALKDFIAVFGRIPLVPRWTFGFWYSRWFEYTDKDIIAIARRYRKAGLPMDVMVIDTEWRTHFWVGYDWHKKRFPNPKKLIKTLHDMGLIVPLNDHPGYNETDPLPYFDTLIPRLKRKLKYPRSRGLWAANWADPECTRVWKEVVLSKQFKDGIDFWWIDGWAERTFENVKGQLLLNQHYFETTEQCTGKRGIVLSRWGGWGSHRYPVQFSGDTRANWETLRHQIHFTADSCGAGACYWSHDIGGFHDDRIPDDLYIRWIQFGAFSPVFRTHSAFGTREPFEYSKLAQKVFKQVTRQRYAMIPYYYQLAREAHDTGMPICRPMCLHYPAEKAAYPARLQYTIGRDILVVPGFLPGDNRQRDFWVPPGTWVRPETGDVFRGANNRTIAIPLQEIPVFYRLGSIIPCQEVMLYSSQKPLDPLFLDVYPGMDETAQLNLYEDDGETKEYTSGNFCRTLITCCRTQKSITVTINKPRGSFPGQLKKRAVVANIWLAPHETVKSGMLNGVPLAGNHIKMTKEYAAGSCMGKAVFVRIRCACSHDETHEIIVQLK